MCGHPRDTRHGTSPEAIHIPYIELYQRLDEVPQGKPVYTYCRSGFRSHFAYCVLKQHGWGVAFLSGGMTAYHGYDKTPLPLDTGQAPCRW